MNNIQFDRGRNPEAVFFPSKREKIIIVGCNDDQSLAVIFNNLRRNPCYEHFIISATRVSDLVSSIKSQNPDLVILSFDNNQLVLNRLYGSEKAMAIPFLCLTKDQEHLSLYWSANQIVFTYPFECLGNKDFLSPRINSIFLQREEQVPATLSRSIASAVIQQEQTSYHQRDLSRYTLELNQKVDTLLRIKNRITALYPDVDDKTRNELSSIVSSIKITTNDHKIWDDFKLYFEHTNPNFLLILQRKYPTLTSIDLKYCCYLKMNMSNDDIKNLLGINQESVRTHKYRLKRKMSLSKDQDLCCYLKTIES